MALTELPQYGKLLCTTLSLLACNLAFSQVQLDDVMMNKLFEARVKTFDEFLARFNGTESFPGIKADDTDYRNKNILSVFDFNAREDRKSYFAEIMEFADSVRLLPQPLCASDSLVFAEARCKVTYDGKHIGLNLIMKQETAAKNLLRWSIIGLYGFLDTESVKKRSISPVENEINFMELDDCINSDYKNIVAYVSNGHKVDQLSYLLGLIRSKQVRFVQCERVTYHVFSVPGYYFKVEEVNRKDTNAGWLITSLKKQNRETKENSIKNLLGI